MKKSKACIIAGIIWGMSLTIPCNAATEYTEVQGECLELSLEDAQLLMRVAQSEAGNQGIIGEWLVMNVILNRVADPAWPSTISDVVYAKHQFTKPAALEDVGPDAHLALAKLESGVFCPDIIGFEVKTSDKLTKYFDEAFSFKDHEFYTKKLK